MAVRGEDAVLRVRKNDETLHVSAGNLCNLACRFCNEGVRVAGYVVDRAGRRSQDRSWRDLDVNAFSNLLKFRREMPDVVFSHGEPTLNLSLRRYVVFAKRLKYRKIEVITNAVRLSDPAYVRSLAAAGMNRLTVSFHAADRHINGYLTGASGARDKALVGIRNAVLAGIPVTVNFVVVRANAADLLNTLLTVRACGASAAVVSFVRLERFPPDKLADNFLTYAHFVRLLRPAARRINELSRSVEIRFTDVPPCILLSAGVDLERSFGLIKSYISDEFGHAARSTTIVRRRKIRACRGCALVGACEGFETDYLHHDPAPSVLPFSRP